MKDAIAAVATSASALALASTIHLAAQGPPQGPDPQVKARVDAFVQALSSGNAETFEAMAQQACTPLMLARRTAADRKQFVEQVKAEFGALSIVRVMRRAEDTLVVDVRGAIGGDAQIELTIEPSAPHRITGVFLRVERGGPDEAGTPDDEPPINGSMAPDELARVLDAYIARRVEKDEFAGVVLVAKDGRPVFERAYGHADRDRRIPIATTTRFNLGSIVKIFTKTAIAQLIAQGKLARTDTVGALLPDYPNAEAKSATVDQLLEHRAGIVDFFGPAFQAAPKETFRANADYYRFVAPRPLLFPPGTKRQYCNGCYIVLGAIIERLSGMRYEAYIAEHVFKPAGMKGAGFFHADRLPPDVALGYTRRGDAGSLLHSNQAMHGAAGSGAGGGHGSAADLLAFDNALREQRLLDAKMTGWLLQTDAARVRRRRAAERGEVPPHDRRAAAAVAEGHRRQTSTVTTGRADGGVGIAGGAPGVNAVLESDKTWTVAVVANLDPPSASRLGIAIHRQLTH